MPGAADKDKPMASFFQISAANSAAIVVKGISEPRLISACLSVLFPAPEASGASLDRLFVCLGLEIRSRKKASNSFLR